MGDEKIIAITSNERTVIVAGEKSTTSSSSEKTKNVLHHDGSSNNAADDNDDDDEDSSGGAEAGAAGDSKDNGNSSSSNNNNKTSRHCNSLPLFQNSELCEIGSRPGMECMPLRAPPGPYHHYHVTDQTKSLQELQNEVGALLEFRDLVIETFPDLKHKMASMSTTNTLTGMASSSSLASRREWEPGIRVKRKITQKENAEMSSSSLIRSRSNSHSGKKEPKSGEGNGSVVQDSGFSTETSSSKEAHSASSTSGAMQGAVTANRLLIDANDELLNLLDVIHRKSNRLRDEVEHLQNLERTKLRRNVNNSSNSSENNNTSCLNKTFQEHVDRLNKEDIQLLRKERDRLLDKLAEMEAETLAGRIKATKMQDQFEELCSVKKELEEQLKLALSQKLELNTRLHELHKQYASKSSSSSQSDSASHRNSSASSTTTVVSTGVLAQHQQQQQGASTTTGRLIGTASTFTPVVVDQTSTTTTTNLDDNKIIYPFHSSDHKSSSNDLKNLGHLDGLVSSPNRLIKVRMTDSKKIAAILLETNVLELQRHLLTLTVQNQVLTQRLEQATKGKIGLINNLDKSKDVIEDLRFQLEEKNIELEGTKAQLRVLESKTSQTPSKLDLSCNAETNRSSSTIILSSRDSPMTPTQISTPSMKAMIPLPMDEIQQHSSSTESAQDHTEREPRLIGGNGSGSGTETPKRRPSKIPLPGSKGYLAPKPPTGRTPTTTGANLKSPGSGPGSNKSLSRSTGSLYGKSGPPSSIRRDTMPQTSSLNRPESAQSIRKDNSLGMNSRSSSSSIPISSKSTPSPHKISNSPLPKLKRDSLMSRVRHLDSLSRVYNSPTSPTTTGGSGGGGGGGNSNSSNNSSTSSNQINNNQLVTGSSTTNLHTLNSSSKKDLSSSFTQGQSSSSSSSSRDRSKSSSTSTSTVAVRRVSSASVGRSATVELQQNDTDNGKINKLRKVESMDSISNNKTQINRPPPSSAASSKTTPSSPYNYYYWRKQKIAKNNQNTILSGNLINEYIAKTCPPPPILQLSNPIYKLSSSPDAQMELAYKHPQLLFDMEMDEEEEQDEDNVDGIEMNERYQQQQKNSKENVSYQKNRELEEKYVPIVNASSSSSSSIRRAKWCTNSIINRSGQRPLNQCRLIGKVNPVIAKAWDQLKSSVTPINNVVTSSSTSSSSVGTPQAIGIVNSNNNNSKDERILSRSVSNNSDDSEKILFYQPVLENEENFHVNKITYSNDDDDDDDDDDRDDGDDNDDDNDDDDNDLDEDDDDDDDNESCNFYDSIDDNIRRRDHHNRDNNNNNNNNSNNHNYDNMVSICHQEAEEEMAEFDSYECKKYCWSLDSEFK